jgi:hypothetical protein
MPQEGIHAVPNQIAGRFMSSEKKHRALGIDFLFGQNLPFFRNIEQKTDKVDALVPPALRNCVGEERSKIRALHPVQRLLAPQCDRGFP